MTQSGDAMTQQGRPEPPSLYENYPVEPIAPPRRRPIARGAGRGAVAGMATAALTTLAVVPPRFGPETSFLGAVVMLTLFYATLSAVVAAAPGAAAGGILSALARAGATSVPIRLLGGLAAATSAALANAPVQILDWPSAVVATMCGAIAAPWVAWGSDRPTLV